jgi:hypothetical protein
MNRYLESKRLYEPSIGSLLLRLLHHTQPTHSYRLLNDGRTNEAVPETVSSGIAGDAIVVVVVVAAVVVRLVSAGFLASLGRFGPATGGSDAVPLPPPPPPPPPAVAAFEKILFVQLNVLG